MRSRRTLSVALAAVVILAAAVRPRPAAASSAAGQEALQATVTTVYDGDTVKVRIAGRTDERVRLIGVDSPELDDPRENVRLMAFLAKRFAFQRLFRTQVDLLPGPEERDSYGRLLAFVRTADGGIFNVTLVREGYATAFLKFPFDEKLRKDLKAAETEARQAGRGLWGREPYPVIQPGDAGRRVGEVLTVRFRCLRSLKRGSVRLLEADGAAFDAVIPLDIFRSLPGPLDFEGRTVEATGLVELYQGRPQIMIGVPVQIKRID
ncbi:MAG TPA: thermonuclease family protein [Acidobacteriota bacterium]|nr:thermonuclease family protein [Acidobacteriota bacterium]